MVFRDIERGPILETKEDIEKKEKIWKNLEFLSENGVSETINHFIQKLKELCPLVKIDFRLNARIYETFYSKMLKKLELNSEFLSQPQGKLLKRICELSVEEIKEKIEKAEKISTKYQEKAIEKVIVRPGGIPFSRGHKFEPLATLLFNVYEIPAIRSSEYDDLVHESKEFPSPDILLLHQDQILALDTTLISYEPPFKDLQGMRKLEKALEVMREQGGIKLSFGLLRSGSIWIPRYFPDIARKEVFEIGGERVIINPSSEMVPILAFPLAEERFRNIYEAISKRSLPSTLHKTFKENFLEPLLEAINYQKRRLGTEKATQFEEIIKTIETSAKLSP